ncbi:preprotein translocase subunit SecE [Candidatus Kaiserbacteria bacterium RIFCSPHIGHO2_01_FULL_50_13]|uniref:Preprotein translocase subunit SecE n=1 Tax=Candidatus Kaiserbacteria bacterium RIFCSPLOWO2_01_FULL_50_24 TaxID=1798507 RepID=A0A1F6ER29_9BACT|nr:MAG: preprotein translocase subunit SecE [Candidatus Kaiserbacteria bacterium RIFCSPHIGHO2_01_FULL_50_13]OGG76084.1 MAG: preprotein translocase subunit SecE [Candidatus Kaiserbacteria bacterium RIFCSPLOWO2_01_FULL_50_24]OGG81711.1 MAG: preprotein translocase subunit SecE [Candidatus Kaiserbacteria bacterium RIFCSPLOWO2_02_FULL_51_13]
MWQYIKDTRGELRHVAWPTQMQTVIYTTLVIAISLFVAAYLGLFDFLFTSGLETALGILPESLPPQTDVQLLPGALPGPEITITDPVSGEVTIEGGPTLQIVPEE